MAILQNLSIRNKVTVISMLTCIIVLFLTLLTFIIIELTISRRALVEQAATLAEVIGINSTAALTFNDKKSARETLAALAAESEIEVAAIYTRDGKLFAQHLRRRPGSGVPPTPLEPPNALSAENFAPPLKKGGFQYAFHGNYLELVKPVTLERESIGRVYLKWSLGQLYQRLRWYTVFAGVALLPSLLVAFFLASRFQRLISQPIMGLAQTMKMVSQEKNYTVQVAKQSEDELGALIDGFNEMLAQIQKRDAALEGHREALEQEVAQRTAQLSHSNRFLEESIATLNRTTGILAQNERRLAYAQMVARLGYWEWHADVDRLICSGEVCRFLGLEPEENGMTRAEFLALLHADDQESVRKTMDASLAAGKSFGVDCRILAPDGSRRILHLQGEVAASRSGNLFKMTGTIQDITERKEAEKALAESEEKYRALMDNASEGILLADVEGNLLEPNKKMLEMADYSLDELLKLNFLQIAPATEANRAQAAFQELLARGSVAVTDAQLMRRDGGIIPIDLTASLVRYAGKTVVQAIFRDISERKKMEEERLLLSKLESLGLLAGGLAHDFNNILTAILGNISLARMEAPSGPKLTDDLQRRLAEAEKACYRARALAGQLLSFAKGGLPIKKATAVPAVLQESVNLALSGSKARSQLFLSKDLWRVEVDDAQISQVFNNLLINADQAMPEGGIITIRAENVIVGDESTVAQGDYVKITVSDQGVGIPPHYLGKIFDPYFTTKQKGSGLGLATSYSIIRNNAGYLTVESEVGVGTSFTIFLPATHAENPPPPIAAVEPLRGQGRILVMDDEEMVRELLIDMLERLGYEAVCAADGEEAIQLYHEAQAANRPFTAAIFDLTVPGGMGGQEAVNRLLAIDPHLKAIVSSGYSDDPIMANFKTFGFQGVISKPYRIIDLSKTLGEVITVSNN
jgi:two-component system cell cycle sensor histidine kinase/response regulator CckA